MQNIVSGSNSEGMFFLPRNVHRSTKINSLVHYIQLSRFFLTLNFSIQLVTFAGAFSPLFEYTKLSLLAGGIALDGILWLVLAQHTKAKAKDRQRVSRYQGNLLEIEEDFRFHHNSPVFSFPLMEISLPFVAEDNLPVPELSVDDFPVIDAWFNFFFYFQLMP